MSLGRTGSEYRESGGSTLGLRLQLLSSESDPDSALERGRIMGEDDGEV